MPTKPKMNSSKTRTVQIARSYGQKTFAVVNEFGRVIGQFTIPVGNEVAKKEDKDLSIN
jgi:hypothetical protein